MPYIPNHREPVYFEKDKPPNLSSATITLGGSRFLSNKGTKIEYQHIAVERANLTHDEKVQRMADPRMEPIDLAGLSGPCFSRDILIVSPMCKRRGKEGLTVVDIAEGLNVALTTRFESIHLSLDGPDYIFLLSKYINQLSELAPTPAGREFTPNVRKSQPSTPPRNDPYVGRSSRR